MQRAQIDGITLAYESRGSGEPVVFIHGALIADTFKPLLTEAALSDFRLIRYHRRGHGGSSPAETPSTMQQNAEDCLALMRSLGAEPAHVVGHSGGGVIALEVVRQAPGSVRSLTLMEPALLDVPSGAELFTRLAPVLQAYASGDKQGAAEGFINRVCGDTACAHADSVLPGSMQQVEADADTFFGKEFPGFSGWSFTKEDAARVNQPVLAVIGAESGERSGWSGYAEIQARLLDWFPQAKPFVLPRAAHLLQVENPHDMAEGLAAFLSNVPVSP
jgi:3-oxoadipate enol-lactonase